MKPMDALQPRIPSPAAAASVTSVVSDSVRPHRWQPTRLPRPWDSPGKNTGVGCHFLLQCMKVKNESEVAQSCPTLRDPMAPPSMGFSRQEYGSGVPLPFPPSPTTIPQNWHIIIINLQDCFFTIPLYPLDREKFAFSLPYPNHTRPHKRYQWTILPQRMMNSPTICQYYVTKALKPIRKPFPSFFVIHYINNVLFSAPSVLEI